MIKTVIITHRGLEPSRPDFFAESSYEAFKNHLERGFGIEFDPNFTQDGKVVISHDADLERLTSGKNQTKFQQLPAQEIMDIRLNKGERLCFLDEILGIIASSSASISALHLKGKFQKPEYLDILISYLRPFEKNFHRFLVFDVTPETARYLKKNLPGLILAPSVAHQYDIERYNECVTGTLLSLDDTLFHRHLFDWVWLDEWDLTNKEGLEKKFYTKEIFDLLKNKELKIALVTPELHGTSPGLLGGEAHPDAFDREKLFARIKEIIILEPDAVCTDYPEEASGL